MNKCLQPVVVAGDGSMECSAPLSQREDQAVNDPFAPADAATPVVSAFYDRFPYPGDPLQDGPPPGYNWRWCVDAVTAATRGALHAAPRAWRILDAGCGTGVSTDYLCHLNPGATVLAVDISGGALQVARERTRRSGAGSAVAELRLEQRSLLDLQGEGPFDYINSVGVLHHLNQPIAGLRALADRLADNGLLHLFLYADAGRWEIHRTQRALNLLDVGHGEQGLQLGRRLLAELPAENRLRRHHEQRWALDTAADANFADMYLHPQETSYTLERLFALIEACDLQFAGFSNPAVWDPARLLQGELLERARRMPERQRWALVEALDPEISHFEFFLSRGEVARRDWSEDRELLAASAVRSPCLWGWPSTSLLGRDLEPLTIDAEDLLLVKALEESGRGTSLAELTVDLPPEDRASRARRLVEQGVLLLVASAGRHGALKPS
jgi:SAM-dependent methyltransferase